MPVVQREKTRNKQFALQKDDRGTYSNDHAQLAVLMDIRDELQKLNKLMHCPNVIGGFRAIARIDRRLAKKVKLP